jgi:hypothetical protein
MSITLECGRLCNTVFRNIHASLLAEKHGLSITYHDTPQMKRLGLTLFVGTKNYGTSILMNEDNYSELYNMESIHTNFHTNACFQTKEGTDRVYTYLRNQMTDIMKANPFRRRYGTNQDAFVHIRLDDVIEYSPGLPYYFKAIDSIKFDNLYISSDSPSHSIIQEICRKYPIASIVKYDPVKTIQFGSTCPNIILSHGTFSAVIGYLGFHSTVYYPPFIESKDGRKLLLRSLSRCPFIVEDDEPNPSNKHSGLPV